MKCKHAQDIEKQYVCPDCWKDEFNQLIPIYAKCPNSGHGCFCTGACRRIVGYREPHPLENVR